jgi:hypothetical protein
LADGHANKKTVDLTPIDKSNTSTNNVESNLFTNPLPHHIHAITHSNRNLHHESHFFETLI